MSPKKKCSNLSNRIQYSSNDRDGKKAAKYANRHYKYYTDADAFINDPDIDATYEALNRVPLFVAYY
jgi:predicted dehydrogenase